MGQSCTLTSERQYIRTMEEGECILVCEQLVILAAYSSLVGLPATHISRAAVKELVKGHTASGGRVLATGLTPAVTAHTHRTTVTWYQYHDKYGNKVVVDVR